MKHSNQGWVTLADSKVKLKTQQITNFNSGEFSPQLAGRVDLEAFASSARKISNLLPEVTGGLKKFYGTKHVAEIDSEAIVLVPFINRHEPMALVIRDGATGLVYSDNYVELDVRIPNGLDISLLRWKQINDRILFVHPDVQPFSIDFWGIDSSGNYKFTTDTIEFSEIPYFPIGWKGDYNGPLTFAPVSGSDNTYTATIPGGTVIAETKFPQPVQDKTTYTKTENVGTEDTVSFSDPQMSLIKVNGTTETTIASGVAGSSAKTGTFVKIGSSYRQTGWAVTVSVKQESILRTIKTILPDSTSGSGVLTIKDSTATKISSGDRLYIRISIPEIIINDVVVHPSEEYVSEIIECIGTVFENEITPGRKIKIYADTDKNVIAWRSGETVRSTDIRYSNGHFYQPTLIINNVPCGTIQPSHTSGTQTDGGVTWKYLHSGSTTATILSVDSPIQITVQLTPGHSLPKVSSSSDDTFETFAWSIWGTNNIHPSHIYMVQNRLGLVCNTKNFGAWNSMSVVDNYFDFSTEEYGQQLDTSAIVHLILNNPDNKINWVLSYNSLYMGSDTNEFNISGSNKVITPTSLICNPVSSLGGAAVVPLKYKELNLFVGSKKDELYTIGYDYTLEDYVPKSIGYITNHLLEQGISRLESVHNKDQCVYILHDTGTLSVLNYVGDQAMLAYCNIDAGAPVVDFCSTSAGANRLSYMAVERNFGKISLEYVADEAPTYMWNTFEYSGEEVSEFTIPELANKNVFVVVDGQFIETTLDENGYYKFNEPTTEYAVGIKLVAEVHTQPAFGRKAEGVVQQSVKVSMRLLESGAFEYGDSTDFSKYIKFENWGTDQDYEEPHKLYTGDALLDLATGYMTMANEGKGPYPNDTGVGVNVRASTPEPFNLLSVTEIYV